MMMMMMMMSTRRRVTNRSRPLLLLDLLPLAPPARARAPARARGLD